MLKNKKIIILIILAVAFLISPNFIKENKVTKIDKVLNNEYYSYLPVEAKSFVREVYDKTGEIVLTEKNKKRDKPYLNPKYVTYLSMSDEEKEKVDLIPNTYITDFNDAKIEGSTGFPSSYNIASLNNQSYITPINNQGNSGLCWAFTTMEQAESLLMTRTNTPYNSSSTRFSVRQLDYATSYDSINNYENENGVRELYFSGGNYVLSSYVLSLGKSMIDRSLMPFDSTTSKKELKDVYNFGSSKYELNRSYKIPGLGANATQEQKDNYNNIVKSYIVSNGGAYVGTESPNPDHRCGFINTDGKYMVVDQAHCAGSSGHAMQIVGWDDNYNYKYCKTANSNLSTTNGTCSSGTLKSGKGAWLLRNSWGDNQAYNFVYLGYDSYNLDVNFADQLVSMNNKSWDNVYHKMVFPTPNSYTYSYSTTDYVTFKKPINTTEKLEQVKFMAYGSNGVFSVSVHTDSNDYEQVKLITTTYPGIYTIDLSDLDIMLRDSEFDVIVEKYSNGGLLVVDSTSAFTSNVNKTPVIETNDLISIDAQRDNNKDYKFVVYSSTKNIDSNQTVSYQLYKGNTSYTSSIKNISYNVVAENNINAYVVIDKNIPAGEYTLKTIYNGYTFTSKITILETHQLSGSGTENDPYLIYNESDLHQIRNDMEAHYKLMSDITLTNDWYPVGTSNNPFRGGFDGNSHTITNLHINSTDDNPAGLFGYVVVKFRYYCQTGEDTTNNDITYFKNLTIKNSDITNKGSTGALIGEVLFDPSAYPSSCINPGEPTLNIDNIKIINGSVVSTEYDGGALIGTVTVNALEWKKSTLNIDNIYSSARVAGWYSTGLIGYVDDRRESGSAIMLKLNITNFQNAGIMDVTKFDEVYAKENSISPVVGGLYGNMALKVENFIINSVYNDPDYLSDLIDDKFRKDPNYFILGNYDQEYSPNYTSTVGKGYCFTRRTYLSTELNNPSDYSSWNNFSTYWKMETPNSIKRIPVIKGIDFDYTTLNDITLTRGEGVYLSSIMGGKFYPEMIDYTIKTNDGVISIEGEDSNNDNYYDDYLIRGEKAGTAVVTVMNYYDGFTKDITVTVERGSRSLVTYYKNDNSTAKSTQYVDSNVSFKLNKNTFTRTGYKFVNWNDNPDGGGEGYEDEETISSGISNDLDLYAMWQPNTYKINFNSNGGSGTMQSQTLTYDVSSKLSKNTFTRNHHTFVEWRTNPNGTGARYTDEHNVLNLTANDNEIITLYAIWLPVKYTVTFNSNGGSVIPSQSISYGSKVNRPVDPTRSGYTFDGWYTDASLTVPYNFNSLITGNLTLYAKWKKEEVVKIPVYRLYNPKNGEHLYTTDTNEVEVIYRTRGWGKEGIGWYTTNTGTPVYRLYSPKFNNHLYTSDWNEMSIITARYGWVFDNVINNVPQPVMYSSGSVPIYRLYNPSLSDQHHLTTDLNEYQIIPKWGWRQEGVAMYASEIGKPEITHYFR